MADNNEKTELKKKPTYKFGLKEIDLNTYIYNLGTNVQNYLDKKNDWSEGQKEEFKLAYSKYIQGLIDQRDNGVDRFYTDDLGVINDKQGLLSNTDDDDIDPNGSEYYYNNKGKQVTTDDYNTMNARKQKKYKSFSANREVASYFNLIGKHINPVTTTNNSQQSKEKFDLAKHGFISWWQKRNNPDGGEMDLTPYLNKDIYDPVTKKRLHTNRLAYLSDELNAYLKDFTGDYDFEGSNFNSADSYKEALTNLKTAISDGTWDDSDRIAANKAGISDLFYNAFFTEDETPGRTQADVNADRQKEEAAAKQKALDAWILSMRKVYDDNNYQQTYYNPYYLGAVNANYWTDAEGYNGDAFRQSFEEDTSAWNKFFNKKKKLLDLQGYLNEYLANPFTPEGKRGLAALIGSGYAKKLASGIHAGSYYIPQYERDRRTNSALIYNPTSGAMYYTFIGDIPDEWKKMTEQYNISNGITDPNERYRFLQGGIIPSMQIGGGFDFNAWNEEDRQSNLKNRAKENGRSVREQEAGERKPGGIANAQNPEDGKLKATDVARIASSIADIGSMVTGFWNPVLSAGIGLGSTATTLVTDIAEDGFLWRDAGRALTNAGLDVLGAIPMGVGAASKKIKIARTLGRYASNALAAVSVANGLANGNNIIASINKMVESPKELTVDDWRNIAQGFGLLTGGIGAGLRKYKLIDVNTKNTKEGVVALEFTDKQGNKKMFAFDGDDAKAIRQAQETGNIEEIKNLTSGKYEELNGMELALLHETKWLLPLKDGKWRKLRTQVPVGVKTYDVIQGKHGPMAQTGNWDADVSIRKTMNDLTDLLKSKVDADVKAHQDAFFEPLKKASERRSKQLDNLEQTIIPKKQQEIKDIYTQAGTTDRTSLERKIDDINKNHNITGSAIDTEYNIRLNAQALDVLRRDLLAALPTRTDAENIELNALNAKINANLKWLDDNSLVSLNKLRSQLSEVISKELVLSKLRKYTSDYRNRRRHTTEYNDFVRDYVTGTGDDAVITITGLPHNRPDVELKAKEILDKYFKDGGSIDFDKVRKFDGGGKSIRNTTSTANWYDDMFLSNAMKNYLATLTKDNYQTVNDLQNSWKNNLTLTGYDGNTNRVTYNKNVEDRQKTWLTLGLNEGIGLARNRGKIISAGNSNDNEQGGYVDGFFGNQESLRHFGTKDSWQGRDKELFDFQNLLKSKGLTYTLNENTGMYELGLYKEPQQQVPKETTVTTGTTPVETVKTDKKTDEKTSTNNNAFTNGKMNLPYDLSRLYVGDVYNTRMTDLQKSLPPFYQTTYNNINEPVVGDLPAQMAAKQARAALRNRFAKAYTSDIDKYMAGALEAEVAGLQFETDSTKANSLKIDATTIRNIAAENDDIRRRSDTFNQNKLSAHQTKANNITHDVAKISNEGQRLMTYLSGKEYDQKVEKEKLKALSDSYETYDINQASTYDLANLAKALGFDISDSDLDIYNQVLYGKLDVPDLTPEQFKSYTNASRISQDVKNTLMRRYKGIGSTPWTNIRYKVQNNSETPEFNIVQSVKNGTKLKIANLKSEEADADRFQKMIDSSMERYSKMLNNLSKNIYRLINIAIVK